MKNVSMTPGANSKPQKMEHLPLVSIITPSYNQGQFIEETILSVKNQDYPYIEHIIVDGGSTDNTLEILKKYEGTYNMRWISEPDQGQADAVNKGFDMAQGEIVGWLNSDDVYLGKWVITSVVSAFTRLKNVDVVYGDDALIKENGEIIQIRVFLPFNYKRVLRYGGISQPATFIRRTIIDQHRLRKDLHFTMDLEFWLRLGKAYRFYHLNKVVAGNRLHSRRKMIAQREEARQERLLVSTLYGLRQNWWSALQILVFDKPLVAALRIKGAWVMYRLWSGAMPVFPFIHCPRNFMLALESQLFGSFKDYGIHEAAN